MQLILNQAQAEAVYSAMCALGKVQMSIDTYFREDEKTITRVVDVHGDIAVYKFPRDDFGLGDRETYAAMAAFATAYGLEQR